MYFAVVSLLPFMFVAAAFGGTLFLWSKSKKVQAILVSLLLIPLGLWCLGALGHMALLVRLRSLEPNNVAEIRFATIRSGKTSIVINKAAGIDLWPF